MMRATDELWNLVLLSFLIGVGGTIVLGFLWEAVKALRPWIVALRQGMRLARALSQHSALSRQPSAISTQHPGRIHR